jgi:hypothetical protein
MTRARGKIVVASPCCRTLYTRPNYTSINTMASEYWTDGRDVNSLAPSDWGLRKCKCGKFFIIYKCESLLKLQDLKPVAPNGWELQNWWTRFQGKPSREFFEKNYDTRSQKDRDAELASIPPLEIVVNDKELNLVINSKQVDKDVQIVARRRYWMYLNDSYRDIYRTYKNNDPSSYPEYILTNEVEDNIKQLIALLLIETNTSQVELAELYRQIGDFSNAAQCMSNIDSSVDDCEEKIKVINQLIDQRRQGPAWYMTLF